MEKTERLLKALANRRRLAILRYLKRTAKATVGDIAKHIKLSFKSTSKHLNILRLADVVEKNQVNLTVFYGLSRPLPPVVKIVLHVL